MAKPFDDLELTVPPPGLPIDVERWLIAQLTKLREAVIHENWVSSPAPDNDWIPETDDQWVGNAEQMPNGLTVGVPTGDPDKFGIQGAVMHRIDGEPSGGIIILGFRDEDAPPATTNPGELANAICEVAGAPVLLSGGVVVEVGAPVTAEHYLLIGESVTQADGRHFAPLVIGPRYVPTVIDTFTDNGDYALDLLDTTILGGSTLTQTFAAGDTNFSYAITLTEESSNRTSVITVEVWGQFVNDGGVMQMYLSDDYPMSANSRQDISVSMPVAIGELLPGDQIELRVSAVVGHQQARPWVRGTLRPTEIEIRQG